MTKPRDRLAEIIELVRKSGAGKDCTCPSCSMANSAKDMAQMLEEAERIFKIPHGDIDAQAAWLSRLHKWKEQP